MAFASGLTKLLSMAHLHAQYAALIVAPVQMCADWSYRCVALVEGLRDWRNLLSAATYGWFVAMVLLGRPWEVIWEGLYGPSKARCSQPYTPPISQLWHFKHISLDTQEGLSLVGPLKSEPAALACLASCHCSKLWPYARMIEGPVDVQVAVQSHGLVRGGSASSLEAIGAEVEGAPLSAQAPLSGRSARQVALARRRQRWRSFVGLGLIVAPFIPASNLFFWVSATD